MEKTFCKRCGRKLSIGIMGFGGEPIIEFEDGFYCQKCARERADGKRKK